MTCPSQTIDLETKCNACFIDGEECLVIEYKKCSKYLTEIAPRLAMQQYTDKLRQLPPVNSRGGE